MKIKNATPNDLDLIFQLEKASFPENEAASLRSFQDRLRVFPENFWVLDDGKKIVGHVSGMVTDNDTIHDEMFEVSETLAHRSQFMVGKYGTT